MCATPGPSPRIPEKCPRERSGAFGIVSGRGPVAQGLPTCRMEFIDKGRKNPVAEGDEVLYSRYGGTEITVDGEPLLVLREADILAVID